MQTGEVVLTMDIVNRMYQYCRETYTLGTGDWQVCVDTVGYFLRILGFTP